MKIFSFHWLFQVSRPRQLAWATTAERYKCGDRQAQEEAAAVRHSAPQQSLGDDEAKATRNKPGQMVKKVGNDQNVSGQGDRTSSVWEQTPKN